MRRIGLPPVAACNVWLEEVRPHQSARPTPNAASISPAAQRDWSPLKTPCILVWFLFGKVPFPKVTGGGNPSDRSNQVRKRFPAPQELFTAMPSATLLAAMSRFSGSPTRRSRLPLYSCIQVSITFLLSLGAGSGWLSGNLAVRAPKPPEPPLGSGGSRTRKAGELRDFKIRGSLAATYQLDLRHSAEMSMRERAW